MVAHSNNELCFAFNAAETHPHNSTLFFEFAFDTEAPREVQHPTSSWSGLKLSVSKFCYNCGLLILLVTLLCSSSLLDSMTPNHFSTSGMTGLSMAAGLPVIEVENDEKIVEEEIRIIETDENNLFPVAELTETPIVEKEVAAVPTPAVSEAKKAVIPAKKIVKSVAKPKAKKPVVAKKVVAPAAPKSSLNINKAITSFEFRKAAKQAHAQGKKIFVKFGAKWCLPCRLMEETVFNQPDIYSKLAKEYVVFNVDVDSIDGLNLKQVYNVHAVPTFIILNSNANVIGRYVESKSPEEMRQILR